MIKFKRVFIFAILLPILICLSTAVGALFIGIAIGSLSDIIPIAITHFIVAIPFAIIIGISAFLILQKKYIAISKTVCIIIGIVVAIIPLGLLLIPEVMRYGLVKERVAEMLGYAILVIFSGAFGGLTFYLFTKKLKL